MKRKTEGTFSARRHSGGAGHLVGVTFAYVFTPQTQQGEKHCSKLSGFLLFLFLLFYSATWTSLHCFFVKQLGSRMAGNAVPASRPFLAPIPIPEQAKGIWMCLLRSYCKVTTQIAGALALLFYFFLRRHLG